MLPTEATILSQILKELDNINIEGILFYDIALLSLKKELNLLQRIMIKKGILYHPFKQFY